MAKSSNNGSGFLQIPDEDNKSVGGVSNLDQQTCEDEMNKNKDYFN